MYSQDLYTTFSLVSFPLFYLYIFYYILNNKLSLGNNNFFRIISYLPFSTNYLFYLDLSRDYITFFNFNLRINRENLYFNFNLFFRLDFNFLFLDLVFIYF